jgi:hypothetical protein
MVIDGVDLAATSYDANFFAMAVNVSSAMGVNVFSTLEGVVATGTAAATSDAATKFGAAGTSCPTSTSKDVDASGVMNTTTSAIATTSNAVDAPSVVTTASGVIATTFNPADASSVVTTSSGVIASVGRTSRASATVGSLATTSEPVGGTCAQRSASRIA